MKNVTLKDVARMANVSPATVSYILNNARGHTISPKTQTRVREAARSLNYVPNSAAKRLKTGRSNCIAVRLATTLAAPRYYMALQGIRSYLEPRGYNIILFNDQKTGNFSNYVDACLNTQADGILYICSDYSDISEENLRIITEHHIPLSVIDCMGGDPGVNSVTYDYFASTCRRVEYMLERGIRRLAYITPDITNFKQAERERGFLSLLEGNPEVTYEIVRTKDPGRPVTTIDSNSTSFNEVDMPSFYTAYRSEFVRDAIRTFPPGTGVLFSFTEDQELYTQHLYCRLLEGGDVPDNWYDCTVSFDYPHYNIGYEAARSLLQTIRGSGEVRKLIFQPQLKPTDPQNVFVNRIYNYVITPLGNEEEEL